MSTGLYCQFLEVKRDQWYYLLEDGSAPKNAWDWREYATAYGPFPSEDAAIEHLHDNHANPGGWFTEKLPDGQDQAELDDTAKKLIANAQSPRSRNSWGSRPAFR
jgi:hypothetical protein